MRPGYSLIKILSLSLVFSFLVCPTFAAKKKKKKEVVVAYIPIPDTVPLTTGIELPVKNLQEPSLFGSRLGKRGRYYASNRCGIDISRYQGEIDWSEVKKDPRVTFVYIKATESIGLVDRTYERNLRGAKKVGLPVGVYHFFSPNTPAHQQLANFMKAVNPKTQDLIPIIDVEVAPRRKSQVVPFLKRLRTFVNGVEKYFGCKPMIYTSQYFYNEYLSGKFLDCPFMLAKYSEEIPQVGDNIRFLIWQFTASGSIRGIQGDVDRSCLMNEYTIDDIRYKRK